MHARMNRKVGGFTLTEVVVSLFLLTVGILAATSTLMAVFKGQRYSASLMMATQLAQSHMEDIKSMSYSEIDSTNEAFGDISGYETFSCITTVTPNGDDTLKTVIVQVSADGGQDITLETLIARH